MWFASIWIFTLQLPWELGADFFLRHLLDGDFASNTLSWRWVAGLHTKGKTYLARADNIERFTNGRFNPQGALALNAQPLTETEDLLPDAKLPQSDYLPDEDFIFLVHEDDCHAEGILPTGRAPYLVVGALATSLRSPLNVEAKVSSFAKSAVSDAMQHLGNSKTIIEGDWAAQLIADCKSNNIEHVVTAYCPVGPTAQALAQAKSELEPAGIKLHQIIRPWDRLIWPYANRGFFKVKKKIPQILEELEFSRTQIELL